MDEKTMEKPRVKYYVERQSFFVQAAVILMLLSAAFRLLGCWGLWGDSFFAATQIALPLSCNVLFILCIMLLGKHLFSLTSIPVLLGVVFFIIKSFTFDSWVHTILCIMLYLLVAVLYTATAFGVVRTKWLLVPLFGLPFLYHIFVEDLAAMRGGELTFAAGMQEMSVLCVMLALLCTAFAMKKKKPEKAVELPKIKDPKIVIPEKKAEAAPTADAAEEEAPELAAEEILEEPPLLTLDEVSSDEVEEGAESTT